MAGVTGGDDGNGRLFFHLGSGKLLVSSDGWPRLPPPEPGETLAAFIDRAIVRDRLLQLFRFHTVWELVSPLAMVRPAERTLGWWKEKWPYRAPSLADSALADRLGDEAVWGKPLPLDYHRDRVFWRLAVELFDRLRDGDLVVKGRRMDVSTAEVESVERGLWQNDFMVLRPRHRRGGWFGPEVWEEHQPPTTLTESYCELTVWPASKLPTLALVADQAPAGEQARTPAAERGETPTPNKSGRKPERLNAAIAEMVEAVNQGKLTREALQEIPKKKLDEHFSSAKTTTLYLARKEAVRQLASKGIPTES